MAEVSGNLLWQCRRGMLELDLLLERFLANHPTFDKDGLAVLGKLLAYEDDDLWQWLSGQKFAPAHLQDLVRKIRQQAE